MRVRSLGVAIILVCGAIPGSLLAQPIELEERIEAARGAHAALSRADAETRAALEQFAIDADMELIEWIEEFLLSDELSALSDFEREVVVAELFAAEHDMAQVLLDQGRCPEAHDRVVELLARDFETNERGRLEAVRDQALACSPAQLFVETFPADAELYNGDELLGSVSERHDLPVGEYTLTIRAPDYVPERIEVLIDTPGQLVQVGPVYLSTEAPPDDRSALPRWHEWTLWIVGSAALGSAFGFFTGADDLRAQLALTFRSRPNEEFEAEQNDNADSLELIGWIVGGVGVALIGTGTYLYIHRQTTKFVPPGAIDKNPRWFEYAFWGIGLAGFAWSAVLFTEAAHRESYANDFGDSFGEQGGGAEGLRDRADDLRIDGALVITGAAISILIGTVIYAIRTADEDTRPSEQMSFDLAPSRDGASVLLTVPF